MAAGSNEVPPPRWRGGADRHAGAGTSASGERPFYVICTMFSFFSRSNRRSLTAMGTALENVSRRRRPAVGRSGYDSPYTCGRVPAGGGARPSLSDRAERQRRVFTSNNGVE
ncbi:hypothetical protein EVAR_16298_1 [Eumeta japonica]|uniref:Uncharacterized protein n=1 Tax=Eumeta variegata TaxID=151549 RepID=A0A4C1VFI6_EUMVA|nr:hypothetical protein EVAR_16298_1 [Eumeta japonica]